MSGYDFKRSSLCVKAYTTWLYIMHTSGKWEISDEETKNFGHQSFFQGINDQNWEI